MATDTSIESVSVVPRLSKLFTPSINSSISYNIYYNNTLFHPHSGHNASMGGILTSTGFKISGNDNEQFFDDDGEGNIRTYYFVSGTRNYTSTAAGTINYETGDIKISSVTITSVSDVDGDTSNKIRLIAIPNSYDIVALRNQVLEIDLVNTKVTGGIDSIAVGDESGAISYVAPSSTVSPTGQGY